jgi:hypothetical protein
MEVWMSSRMGLKLLSTASSVVALLSVFSSLAWAEHTRPTNPNALSLEVFGKSFLYTVQYDRAVSDDVFAGVGIGSVALDNLDNTDAGASAVLVPVYAGYYFVRDQGSPFVIAGASLVTNHTTASGKKTNLGDLEFSSSQVLPFFGAGYEVRTDSGFLFRVTGYGEVGKTLKPWGGATFGYAF